MRRNCDLNEITDGRKYTANDMVKADCLGCRGCHSCCTGMGDSVVLDPYDISRLCAGLKCSFQDLIDRGGIALGNYDGIILPYLNTTGADYHCTFLGQPSDGDAEGRCMIHPMRPGLCRLFPLGRLYENGKFTYCLQTGECTKTIRSKIKVEKWVDTKPLKQYDAYIADWHNIVLRSQDAVRILLTREDSAETRRQVYRFDLWLLQQYFRQTLSLDTFYTEFAALSAETDSYIYSLTAE